MYTQRSILKYKLKVGLVIGCAETLNQATVYGHYKKTNRYVTGTKAKPLDFGLMQQLFCALEAVCLIWLGAAVVVDLLGRNFPRSRWVIVLACW